MNASIYTRSDSTREIGTVKKEEYIQAWQKQSQVTSETIKGEEDHWEREANDKDTNAGGKVRKGETRSRNNEPQEEMSDQSYDKNEENVNVDSYPGFPMVMDRSRSRRDTSVRIKPILVKGPFILKQAKKNIHYE